MRRRDALLSAAATALPFASRPGRAALGADPVAVFAAVSLSDALREVAADWARRGGHPAPRLTLAASSALARQIEQGAPADLFLSADEAWADDLQGRGLLAEGTRGNGVGNALVLVAPADAPSPPPVGVVARGADLAAMLGGPRGRLAVGDPAHVPAGRYARAALEWAGQWERLAPRLARAENARAALLLVERGEAPLGVVYATDAAASRGVRVVGAFPAGSHPPIAYPFALTRRAAGDARARALLDHLRGPEAAGTWRRFGFVPLGGDGGGG